jgi:hypothetical protein
MTMRVKKHKGGTMESNPEQMGLNLSVPIGVSGAFLTDKARFSEIRQLFTEYSLLIERLAKAQHGLHNCMHPEWLFSFGNRCRRLRLDPNQELVEQERKLSIERTELTIGIEEVRRQLLQLEPRALDACHTMVGALPFLSHRRDLQESKRQGRKTPAVEARNSVIDCHLKLPNLGICQELDGEFPYTDRPAPQFPDNWFRCFNVKSFLEAYEHGECSRLVQTMISKRRARWRQSLAIFARSP